MLKHAIIRRCGKLVCRARIFQWEQKLQKDQLGIMAAVTSRTRGNAEHSLVEKRPKMTSIWSCRHVTTGCRIKPKADNVSVRLYSETEVALTVLWVILSGRAPSAACRQKPLQPQIPSAFLRALFHSSETIRFLLFFAKGLWNETVF